MCIYIPYPKAWKEKQMTKPNNDEIDKHVKTIFMIIEMIDYNICASISAKETSTIPFVICRKLPLFGTSSKQFSSKP